MVEGKAKATGKQHGGEAANEQQRPTSGEEAQKTTTMPSDNKPRALSQRPGQARTYGEVDGD